MRNELFKIIFKQIYGAVLNNPYLLDYEVSHVGRHETVMVGTTKHIFIWKYELILNF